MVAALAIHDCLLKTRLVGFYGREHTAYQSQQAALEGNQSLAIGVGRYFMWEWNRR